MLEDKEAKDLLNFLTLEMRPDLKGQATGYILGLTGSKDGCKCLGNKPEFIKALLTLTSDTSIAVVKDCYNALINLSADETVHHSLLKESTLLSTLLGHLLDPGYIFADQICTILTNLSRNEKTCMDVFRVIQDEVGLAKIVEVFCTEGYNKNASLHYLGPLLSNLTQLPMARHFILDKDRCVIQRLLSYTQYESSTIRRGGVVGTLRNCCFEYSYHEWLLGDKVDILPCLLLPLAGPEELSEEENENLPVDLQYLPEDKKREKDPDIRKMLLETIMLLTATKNGRDIVRKKNSYPIMREFHKWEKEPDVIASCEKLVQVLIGDDPEPGMENLLEVDIPKEIEEKLQVLDEQEQRQIAKEKEELQKKENDSKSNESLQP